MSTKKSIPIKQAKAIIIKVLAFFIILVAWEFFARFKIINAMYYPPPLAIAERLFHLLGQNNFRQDTLWSLYRLIAGASIAIPLAVIIGMSIAMNKWCSFIFTPLIATLYPMPKLALFPLLLVIFGLGDISKIALITVGIFFWVLFYTLHGVQRLFTEDYMDIAAAFGIPLLKKVRRIVLRGALPEIINGVKTGLGHGLSMVVASEFTFSKNGIGYFIWNAWDQFRIVDMYCGLVVIGSLGIIAYYVPENIKNNLVEINRFGIND